MEQPVSQQSWTVTAPTYSSNVGRTSILSAARLVIMANDMHPITTASRVLDNGAGAGAVTLTIAERYPSTSTLAADTSAVMLESIAARDLPNVTTKVLDARYLSSEVAPSSFSHAFATFMLQTITTPQDVVSEMSQALMPGGIIGIALWARRNGPFEVWERACQAIDPNYKLPSDPFDDPHAWRTQADLETAFSIAGFTEIRSEEVIMAFDFPGAPAFMDFWFNAKNPAAIKCMSNWTRPLDQVKAAMPAVIRDEYADGKDIKTWAVLGVARKS